MKYSNQPWVVLFGGAGREAVLDRMAAEGVTIITVLVPSVRSEKLEIAVDSIRKNGFSVIESSRASLAADLNPYGDANLLSVGFPYLVPREIYKRHRIAINIHPTLLPKYRGPTSGAYILINNESESGSTIHLLEEGADQGDIVAQASVRLSQFDTLKSLQRKVYALEPDLVIEAIRRLDAGIVPVPQDEAAATIFSRRRTPADSEIDPNCSLLELFNQIRACDPVDFPAFFRLDGEKICISLWRENRPCDSEDEL